MDVLVKAEKCHSQAQEVSTFMQSFGFDLEGKTILEMGRYDGIHALYLSQHSKTTVTASDISKYYIVQRLGDRLSEESQGQQNSQLDCLRERCF